MTILESTKGGRDCFLKSKKQRRFEVRDLRGLGWDLPGEQKAPFTTWFWPFEKRCLILFNDYLG